MYCFNKPKLSGCYKLCLGFLFLFFGQFHHRLAFDKWTLAHQPSGPTGPKGGGGGVGGGGEGMEPSFKKGQSFRSFFSSVSGKQIEMVHFLYRRISGQRPLHIFMLEKRVQVWCDFFTHPSL